MRKSLGDKHVEAFQNQHMLPSEEILNWVEALRDGDTFQGRLITTRDRLVYYRNGRMSQKIEAWPISKISSVDVKAGMISTKLKFYTSGDTIQLTVYGDKRHSKEFANELQLAINRPELHGKITDEREASENPLDMITRLAELKAAGVLSEEEFSAKKQEILARI
jgi:Bacterial PH domain/Short C-terminal domain